MVNKTKSTRTTAEKALAAERQLQVQRALYEIADTASAVTNMQSFYRKLHEIVGKLMDAKSFYVTLYDPVTCILTSPYFADESGDQPPPPTRIDETNRSLRAHVLLKGRTLHLSGMEIEAGRLQGRFTPMGTPAEDWIGVPLKTDGQIIGSLTVQSYKKGHRYEELDVQVLEFVAQHIAVALNRARAIEETRQRNAELVILNSVQEGLAGKLDMQSIYELVGEQIRTTFDAQVVSIDTYERDAQILHSRYYFEGGRSFPGGVYPCFGFRKYVIENRQTLVLNSDMPRWMKEYENPIKMGLQSRSAIFIPMMLGEETMGVISLQNNDRENAFTDADVRLLTTLAGSMSVALENARLYGETQRLLKETEQRNAELAIINSVQAGLAAQLNMQSIYELVGEKIREIFDANTVALATFDVHKNLIFRHYVIERGKRYYVDPTPIPAIWHGFIRQGQSTLINSNVLDFMRQVDPTFEVPIGEIPKCALSVPLKVQGEVCGVISLQNVDRENAFSESDQRLLETLANSMSVALESARLFEETQRRNAELAIINSVQEGLASKLNMQAIYELIGAKVREVFHVEVIDIVNYDPVANLISMPYSYEKGDRNVFSPREPYGFRRQVIENRAPLLINQNFEELALQHDNPLLTGAWPKSALFVPLLVEGQVRSIISIQELERENAFSASDVRLLQTLSNAMAVALENARLFDETESLLRETEHRARELATVNTVGTALAGELDLSALIELVGEQVRSVFKADIAFVALLDKENSVIHFPYQYGQQLAPIQLGQGLTSKIIQSGQPLLINEEMDRQRRRMKVKRIGKRARSFLGVPIFVAGEVLGAVSVQSTKQEGRFTETDQRLLSTIAANIGIAFQNARLFYETQRLFHAERQAHEQAETLRAVAQSLNRSLSLPEVFQLVLTEIQRVIPYDSAGIYQVHGNRRVFVAGHGFSNLKDLIGVSFEFNQQEDEIGYLISKSLQPLILDDAPEKYPQYFSTGTHAATKIRSYMAVPIVLNQKLIGMITLDREEPGCYTDEHARLAMAFAAQAATAIHNAQLFDETQQRNAELAIINSVQEGLASKLDLQAIYELVGDKIRDVFDAQAVIIVSYDHATKAIHFNYIFEKGKRSFANPIPFTKMTDHLIQTRESVLINEGLEQHFLKYEIHPATGTSLGKSALWMPLIVDNSVSGVINLYNLDHEYAFSESDVRLLQTLANSLSVALENARLWEQEKLYRKALERELEIGREIQSGFLPEELPAVEGWEIAASLMPAREVAGDFYDAFELPDGTIALVIADVCDKGVGAALFMTLFRSLIRITSNQDTFEHIEHAGSAFFTPGRLQRAMQLTNNYIAETHHTSGMFATIFFGILDPHTGRLMYINGGHEPPLIVRSGQVREPLYKTGPAVGAIPDCQFDVQVAELSAGDLLVAFTDGVPEVKDPCGEFFGHQRLFHILRRCSDSSHELIQTLEAELHRYMDGATQFDDITLLAVKRGYS
jgi:GAF domain-containing protein